VPGCYIKIRSWNVITIFPSQAYKQNVCDVVTHICFCVRNYKVI